MKTNSSMNSNSKIIYLMFIKKYASRIPFLVFQGNNLISNTILCYFYLEEIIC